MKQKSCKLYINIVFLIILTITIFGGNKVYGVPVQPEIPDGGNGEAPKYKVQLEIISAMGNASSCGNSTRALVRITNAKGYVRNVYACVYALPSMTSSVSITCPDNYTPYTGQAISETNGTGMLVASFCKNENKTEEDYGYGGTKPETPDTQTDSGQTGGGSTGGGQTGGGSQTTTDKKDEIHELTCVYEGLSEQLPYPLMIKQDKDGNITFKIYKEPFIGYNGLSNDKWSSSGHILDAEHTKCAKDGKLHCCPRFVEYTNTLTTVRPVDKKKWYKKDYKLIPELSTITFSSINDYFYFTGETGPRNDYDNLCNNEGAKNAVLFIGKIVVIALWVVPLIIIVLGMVDFTKAMMSNDEKAIGKATSALIKRIVAGLAAFIIPTLILAILKNIGITKDIEQNEDYTSCMNCLLYPFNNCVPDNPSIKSSSVVGSLVDADSCSNANLSSVKVSDASGSLKDVNGCVYNSSSENSVEVTCPDGAVKTSVAITDSNGDTFHAMVCSKG